MSTLKINPASTSSGANVIDLVKYKKAPELCLHEGSC